MQGWSVVVSVTMSKLTPPVWEPPQEEQQQHDAHGNSPAGAVMDSPDTLPKDSKIPVHHGHKQQYPKPASGKQAAPFIKAGMNPSGGVEHDDTVPAEVVSQSDQNVKATELLPTSSQLVSHMADTVPVPPTWSNRKPQAAVDDSAGRSTYLVWLALAVRHSVSAHHDGTVVYVVVGWLYRQKARHAALVLLPCPYGMAPLLIYAMSICCCSL